MPHKSRKPRGRRTEQTRHKTEQGGPPSSVLRPPSCGRRVWLFRLASLIIAPVLFLGLLELGLRAIGYGFDPRVTVACEIDGQPHLGDNVQFGWRFFPPILAREFEPFAFPTRKSPDTLRVFVLGESAAQGAPNNAFRFGRILEAMLHERFPDTRFEVITAATAAINSHVVLEIARECARYEPDLFVVYMGNNEVVGPYGPGTVLTPVLSNLRLIRLGIRFRGTKTGQMLSGLLGTRLTGKDAPQYWRGMEMFLGQQVRADDPRLRSTYSHFRRNLEDICRVASGAGAQVILCTVGSNLRDCPPFASLHRSDLTAEQRRNWNTAYREGTIAEGQGRHAEAVAAYLRAAQIDGSHAELQFRLARLHAHAGDRDEARERYIKARDLDTLRFRPDTRINEIIRAVADRRKSRGVVLADTAGVLDANSPHGLSGEEFFYEHVHLTFAGNYLLARTVLEQIESLHAPSGPILTHEQSAERLGYNDWSRAKTLDTTINGFLLKPPFTNQLDHKQQIERFRSQLEGLKAALTPEGLEAIGEQYLATIAQAPDDWRLRWDYGQMLAEDLNRYDAAIEQYRIVRRFLPHSHMPHDALASVLRVKGDLAEAIGEYEKVLAIKPTLGAAWYHLGWCHQRQGNAELAMDLFRKAIRFEPDCVPAYLDLAELLYKGGRLQEAEKVCRDGLAVVPNHPRLHGNLGLLLIKMGNRQEGAAQIRKALELDPASPQIRRLAETLLGPGATR